MTHTAISFRVERIKESIALIHSDLQFIEAFNEACGLAFSERTGQPLGPDGEYSKEDEIRAEEIVKLLLKSSA